MLACGGWYFGSQPFAMLQLRDAAQSGDPEQLEAQVDFPALRDDMKAELRARVEQELDASDNPLGRAGAAIGVAMLDRMIDGLVTPTAIAGLVRGGEMVAAENEAASPPADEGEAVDWDITREGLSRFTARPISADGDAGPELEFARDGLGWKLVGINLPAA